MLIVTNDSIDVTMVDEIFIYKIDISILRNRENELTLLDSSGHIRFIEYYLTFQPYRKDEGIKKVINYLNASIEDVVVFWDNYSELVMFNDEWISIAMGNVCDEL